MTDPIIFIFTGSKILKTVNAMHNKKLFFELSCKHKRDNHPKNFSSLLKFKILWLGKLTKLILNKCKKFFIGLYL